MTANRWARGFPMSAGPTHTKKPKCRKNWQVLPSQGRLMLTGQVWPTMALPHRPILLDKHQTDVSESSVSMISQLQSNIAANFDRFCTNASPMSAWGLVRYRCMLKNASWSKLLRSPSLLRMPHDHRWFGTSNPTNYPPEEFKSPFFLSAYC